MMITQEYTSEAVTLLSHLIATPSISRNEQAAADLMETALRAYGFAPRREANNLWAIAPHFDEQRPTVLLNAHIDTVKPVASWTRDPRGRHPLRTGQQRLRRRTGVAPASVSHPVRNAP